MAVQIQSISWDANRIELIKLLSEHLGGLAKAKDEFDKHLADSSYKIVLTPSREVEKELIDTLVRLGANIDKGE